MCLFCSLKTLAFAIWLRLRLEDVVLPFLGVFVFLVFVLLRNSLVFLSVFCLLYRVLKRSHGGKILFVSEVFLGIFEKTNEKKGRVEEGAI